jgi:hypothetical protein
MTHICSQRKKISKWRLRTTDEKTKLLNLGTGFKVDSTCGRRKVLCLLTQTEVKNGKEFWHIMLCSPMKVNWCFRWPYYLHLQGQRISRAWSFMFCFLLLGLFFDHEDGKDGTSCSSVMSVDFQRTTWRYTPEDRTLLIINLSLSSAGYETIGIFLLELKHTILFYIIC